MERIQGSVVTATYNTHACCSGLWGISVQICMKMTSEDKTGHSLMCPWGLPSNSLTIQISSTIPEIKGGDSLNRGKCYHKASVLSSSERHEAS